MQPTQISRHFLHPLQPIWVDAKYVSQEVAEDYESGLEYAQVMLGPWMRHAYWLDGSLSELHVMVGVSSVRIGKKNARGRGRFAFNSAG